MRKGNELKINAQAHVHMRTHSLHKPYQCKWCDYSSITKSYLYTLQISSPTLHYAAIVSVREWKKWKKSKWLDFTHFSTKQYFFVCTGVKMHIFYKKNVEKTCSFVYQLVLIVYYLTAKRSGHLVKNKQFSPQTIFGFWNPFEFKSNPFLKERLPTQFAVEWNKTIGWELLWRAEGTVKLSSK